jgi:hypothetical protein
MAGSSVRTKTGKWVPTTDIESASSWSGEIAGVMEQGYPAVGTGRVPNPDSHESTEASVQELFDQFGQ